MTACPELATMAVVIEDPKGSTGFGAELSQIPVRRDFPIDIWD